MQSNPSHKQYAASTRQRQRGQVIVIFAFLIMFLLLLLGLMLDSVRLFTLSAQAERTAEAAALAGALYLPDYFMNRSPDGQDAMMRACGLAQENQVSNCPAGMGQVGATPSVVPGHPNELQVTVTLQADVFFLAYVAPNLSSATVSSTAYAEYLPAIALGSRSSAFGDQADEGDAHQSFFARINGPLELQENGDLYTPHWQEGPTDPIQHPDGGSFAFARFPSSGATNHQQWPTVLSNPYQQPAGFTNAAGAPGYNYEITVPQGAGDVMVKIYNPAFDPPNGTTQDDIGSACLDPAFIVGGCITDQAAEYLQMSYSLYFVPLSFERSKDRLLTTFSPPSLDLYPGDITTHCGAGSTQVYNPVTQQCIDQPEYVTGWQTLYTITKPGTYRLVAAATGFYGEHGYGIKLTDKEDNSAPTGVRIWGWNNMCVYFSTTGADSIFDIGEIPPDYAGKTLNFTLFDPGDSSGNVFMRILDPSGNPVQFPSWVRTVSGSGGTELDASGRFYNGLVVQLPITIPANYSPAPGEDWWKIEYLTPNCCPTDTVTISISLNGSPIHLVNEIV
ncbi:MAG TPA: pilus assembly protein TadG-related protein [Ktedonobacterales bacterium]